MLPSSRTPEGDRGRCPVCQAIVRMEPSSPTRDAPCPCCGTLIWFRRRRKGKRPSASHALTPSSVLVRPRLADSIRTMLRNSVLRFRLRVLAKWAGLAVMLAGSTLVALASIASLAPENETLGNMLGFAGIAALAASIGLFLWLDRSVVSKRN